jgi:hypothetical protein
MKHIEKSKLSTIALILLLAISVTLVAVPFATAQTPATVYPYPYINAVPNPVQVNQPVLFHVGSQYPANRPASGWYNLAVEITDPNGGVTTITVPTTDLTGGTGVPFTPTMVGDYSVRTHFPEQVKDFSDSYTGPVGTVMEDAYSEPLTLVVQAEPIQYWPVQPLPQEYWTRPINGQIWEWATIAAPWYETILPTGSGVPSMNDPMRELNEYAPETGHILFREQLQMAGLAGGLGAHQYESGDAYEPKWAGSCILGGILFYNQFPSGGGTSVEQVVVAVDLHTGEELWRRTLTAPDGTEMRLSFGWQYYFEGFNYHGVFSYLVASVSSGYTGPTTYYMFDPFSGRFIFALEGIPSGNKFNGPNGEIFIYVVNKNAGTISLWNSTAAVMYGRTSVFEGSWLWGREGSTIDAANGISWTVTVPELPGLAGRSVYKARDGILLGANFARGSASPDPAQMWVIAVDNYNPENTELLWDITWSVPSPLLQISVEDVSLEEDLILVSTKQERTSYGFRLSTGELIWGPTASRFYTDTWGHSSGNSWDIIASGYNKVIAGNYGGTVWCYDAQNGSVLWTYDIVDPYAELLHNNRWRFRPSFITNGKLYIENTEHNPEDPQHRGAPFICLDIETGENIWQLPFRQSEWSSTAIIGDSIIVAQNTYDQFLYAIGKGPSKTTVEAPLTAVTQGSSVIIRGTVMDISPGTNDPTIALRFPDGLPAVSDASMTDWMTYVWNQFTRPTNVEGVNVFVKIQDPNGDWYSETVTADANGVFSMMWDPSIVGEYHVTAMFEGTKSYFGSQATTTFGVDAAPATLGYSGPSADEIATRTINMLPPYPNVPTSEEIAADAAQRTINMLPPYPDCPATCPEMPAYLTIDLAVIVLVIVGILIGLYIIIKKQK